MAESVSVVVPALDEAARLPDSLASLQSQTGDEISAIVVVDGGSTDGTRDVARSAGVRLLDQSGMGIAAARNQGARATTGQWLAFVDADTTVDERWVEALRQFCEVEGLAAASARCRVVDEPRGKAMQSVLNRVFPHLRRPILPGFNLLVRRDAFDAVGGFPEVPNEDTALSRRLGRAFDTGYHPDVLVETSGRRFATAGMGGALRHYLELDWQRLRANY